MINLKYHHFYGLIVWIRIVLHALKIRQSLISNTFFNSYVCKGECALEWIPSSLNEDKIQGLSLAKLWLTIHLGGSLSILHHPNLLSILQPSISTCGEDL